MSNANPFPVNNFVVFWIRYSRSKTWIGLSMCLQPLVVRWPAGPNNVARNADFPWLNQSSFRWAIDNM